MLWSHSAFQWRTRTEIAKENPPRLPLFAVKNFHAGSAGGGADLTTPRPSRFPGRTERLKHLVYGNGLSRRLNAVGDNINRARTGFDAGGHIEGGRNGRAAGGDTHGAEVVGAGEEEMLAGGISNHYQREAGGHLAVVAVGGAGREAVELGACDGVRVAM